jgi:hypothetical protein
MNKDDRQKPASARPQVVWAVAASPLIALAAFYWKAIGMKGGRFPWAAIPVMWLTNVAIAIGFAGGIYLATTRRTAWWLLITAVSAVLGYIQVDMIVVSGMARMH